MSTEITSPEASNASPSFTPASCIRFTAHHYMAPSPGVRLIPPQVQNVARSHPSSPEFKSNSFIKAWVSLTLNWQENEE
ncbi:hypothetical protein RRG08_044753 [Elysia crispata]|uniref:Uncharacterized protein n=1 Tax=Elysia crispata TaxID=231223 RepID=A0AAE1DHE5_9GAST|nr:hypothetical protein RRG08_044753 [Elysia crispata]